MNRLQTVATALGAVLLALCLGLIGGHLWGGHRQAQIDEGRAAKVSEQHAIALASATERYREAERSGQAAVAAITAAAQQEKDNAKKQMDILRGKLRTGAVRLSVAVDAASAAAAARAASAGDREARADLLPAAADVLLDFAIEGDDIVRELNACVDKYHRAEQVIFESKKRGAAE
ncbi:lysis system i-spanin subunit Rz [Herbaspirillum sp. 1130]|uniref:lysis system i-spanin subunit Rz n=1 Tax=Herbaspirillum sp. 1130 TaxID=2806562 RepID=UPI001AE2E02F|nr:lysis system i-spanin subunit Rz [Herbaspirillum sp. 1130]MBP1314422.1 small-conductance mechanosensitive channel [Herbaspirillum sp. 1130]